MESLVFVFIIAAFGFLLGRTTKRAPSSDDPAFANSPLHSSLENARPEDQKIPLTGARLTTLIFISGWIIAWTAGIFMALNVFFHSFGENIVTIFFGGWLLAAIAGWVAAAMTIYKLITGKPVKSRGGEMY